MKFFPATACLLLLVLAVPVPPAAAESLLEIYQRALQSDPLIGEAEANRLAAEEAAPQARAALLPQLFASGEENRSESDGINAFQQQLPDGSTRTITTGFETEDGETTQWQIQLTQTLFRWDQFVGLKQAHKRVAQAQADYEAAQQDLLIRVSTRYFDVLGAEDALTAQQATKRAIERQLDQARKRFEVGLIAITDVQEAQAAFDQATADEIAAKRTLATAREFLREITGAYIEELAAPRDRLPLSAPAPTDEDSWVATAMDQNLSLVASRLGAEIAADEVGLRRSDYYPSIDLVVSRSDFEAESLRRDFDPTAPGPLPPLSPVLNGATQDTISVQVNVPLFSGGSTRSRVREAVYLHRAARERLQRVARETERSTRDAYLGVLSEMSRVQALAQAVESSRTALQATEAGFDVGTRTTVDVLDAQRQLFDAMSLYERARYDYLLNVLRLKQAAGILRVQDLEEIERWLAPRPRPAERANAVSREAERAPE